jgi:hypothetical protein
LLSLAHFFLGLTVQSFCRQRFCQSGMITGIRGSQFHGSPKLYEGIIYLPLVK